MSASLIGRLGSSTFRISTCSVHVAHGLVLLSGIGRKDPRTRSEQSIGRPCRQLSGRSKRTCELTSSLVPRGTSFHRRVELECVPIGCDLLRRHAACQSKHRPDGLGFAEASGHVDSGSISQRHHGADTRGRHQAPARLVIPDEAAGGLPHLLGTFVRISRRARLGQDGSGYPLELLGRRLRKWASPAAK